MYRRSGGHSYGSTVPGPIGSVLTPGLDLERYAALPFASTLCGSCTAVCPVKIDLDAQLYAWRQEVTAAGLAPRAKGRGDAPGRGRRSAGRPCSRGWGGRRGGRSGGSRGRSRTRRPNVWAQARDLPAPPAQTFREWVREHRPDAERGRP